jgi:F0F1-type ATP synthase membrane subunit c/vacuolar-type H+-ATPase subunit K
MEINNDGGVWLPITAVTGIGTLGAGLGSGIAGIGAGIDQAVSGVTGWWN